MALIPPPLEFAARIKPTPERLLWAERELFCNVCARDIGASLIMTALARRLTKGGGLEHPQAIQFLCLSQQRSGFKTT